MFGWVSLDEFALGERDVWGDPSGRRELAATLPAIRKDVGPSRSPSALDERDGLMRSSHGLSLREDGVIGNETQPSRSPSAHTMGAGRRDEGRSSVSDLPPPTPKDVP